MRDDTPDDLVHDLFTRALFPDHPLGREVLGSRGRRSPRCRATASPSYHHAHYQPSNIVFAAAGNLTPRHRARAVDEHFPARRRRARPARPRARPVESRSGRSSSTVTTEQAHLVARCAIGAGARSRSLRAHRREPGARRRDVVAPVPGDPRAAWPRVLGVLVPRDLRRRRVPRDLRRDRARAGAGDPRRDRRRARPARPRGSLRLAELEAAKGHLTGSIVDVARDVGQPHAAPGRAELVEGEIPSLDELVAAHRRGDRGRCRRVIDRVFADAPGRSRSSVRMTNSEFDRRGRARSRLRPMIRVGVFGAGGRMGTTVCDAVRDAPDMELVAAVDPVHAGDGVGRARRSPPTADALEAAGARGRGRLHRARRGTREPPLVRGARRARGRRHHRVRDAELAELAELVRAFRRRNAAIVAELRDRRGAHDALRGDGRALLRDAPRSSSSTTTARSTRRRAPRCAPRNAWPPPRRSGPTIRPPR